MNFEGLKHRVERAEQLVDGRICQVQEHRAKLGIEVRQALTPGRIVIAGLVGGFLVARARPLRTVRAVSATRWVQLATSLSGLFASLKAAYAAETAESAAAEAESAADTAEAVAEQATPATAAAARAPASAHAPAPTPAPAKTTQTPEPAPRSVSDARRRPDTQWQQAPRAAEAATEISEPESER